MLQHDETVLWSGYATLRAMWPMMATGLVLFGGGVWLFWAAAMFRGTMVEYCNLYHSSKCGMVFVLAWPMLAASSAFVLGIIFIFVSYVRGWMQQSYAVTNLRAIRVDRKAWRNPPERQYSVDLSQVTSRNERGLVAFTGRSNLYFVGLSRSQRMEIISLIDEARKEPKP